LSLNKNLWKELRAELPGILAWAVAGCLAWQHDGLEPPASITDAVAGYRIEQDLAGEFLAEHTEVDAGSSIAARDLYVSFRAWCENAGEDVIPKQKWLTERVQRRYPKIHKENGDYFAGIRLRAQSQPEWPGFAVPFKRR
jgi:putative DNA primase/helicase